MKHSLIAAFVPSRVLAAQRDSFRPESGGIPGAAATAFYGLPIVSALASAGLGWAFLAPVAEQLIAGAALLGSVMIAVSTVVLQIVVSESHRSGHATTPDRRRVGSLRNIYGLIASGALVAFTLVGGLIWLSTFAAPFSGMAFAIAHATVLALTVFTVQILLRVVIVTDAVVQAYSTEAKSRAA